MFQYNASIHNEILLIDTSIYGNGQHVYVYGSSFLPVKLL